MLGQVPLAMYLLALVLAGLAAWAAIWALQPFAARLGLLDHQRKVIALEFGGLADDDATPDHGGAPVEQGRCGRAHRR